MKDGHSHGLNCDACGRFSEWKELLREITDNEWTWLCVCGNALRTDPYDPPPLIYKVAHALTSAQHNGKGTG